MISELGDHCPAVGMADENDWSVHFVEHLAHVSRVGRQVAQRCRVDACAGQLLHHGDIVTGLIKLRHQVIPDPAAAPRAMSFVIVS